MTRTKHNSNRELIGQGIGNAMAGMFGGLAGAGATMRTAVNIKSGGTDRLSGVVHCLFLLTVLIVLAPAASKIPLCVLAAILIKVGVDIIDYKFLGVIKKISRRESAVMVVVFLLTVFHDLIFAVGVGIVLSSLLFAASVSEHTNVENIKLEEIGDIEENLIDENYSKLISFVRIDGAFFFGSSALVLNQIEKMSQDMKCMILYCRRVVTIDISAVFVLEEMLGRLKSHGISVIPVFKNEEIAKHILELGLSKYVNEDDIAYDKESAVQKAKTLVEKYLTKDA